MEKTKFQRYAELKMAQKKIAEEIDSLTNDILNQMSEEGVDDVVTPLGKFSLMTREKFTFDDEELKALQEAVKERKTVLTQVGDFGSETTTFLKFTVGS